MPSGFAPLTPTNAGKAQKAALAASAANLILTTPASTTTITTPTTAPTTTGYTDIVPASTGYAATITGNTTTGSTVVTGVSSTAALVVGMPLIEATSLAAYPANVPMGATITAINAGASTVTISRPATGTASGITLHAASDLFHVIGGVAASYNNNFTVSGATSGNAVNPPTATNVGYNGWAIEFMTDAANFTTAAAGMIVTMYQNGAAPNAFRVAVDNVYQSAAPVTFGTTGTQWLTIQFSSAGTHKVRIEFASLSLLQHIWLYTGSTMWRSPASNLVRAAFYGDSFFCSGASNSWPMRNVASQTALLLGWMADFVSVAGTGYVSGGGTNYNWASPNRTADVTRRSYNVIVVLGSVNDVGQSAAAVQANALTCFQALRANAPGVPIFVFGCPTTVNANAAAATIIENAVSAAFTQWADGNSYFIPVTTDIDGDWITSGNSGNYAAADGTHLTDPNGCNYYAARMAHKLSTLLSNVVI